MTTTATTTYAGPAGTGLPATAGLPGVRRHETGTPTVSETERLDTADRRLAAAGMALVHDDTWRLDVGGETVEVRGGARLPAGLSRQIRGTARGSRVRPVATLRTVRTVTRLLGDDGAELATLVHDEITIATLGRSTNVYAWTELTVTVGEDLRDALEQRLAASGLHPAAPGAAAELRRLAGAPRRPRGRKGSAGRALLEHVARHVERIAVEDVRVRRGEPDSVHRMRVASRRLRSALRTYRPLLDRERTDPIVAGLRDLGRALAPARDAEVLRESIDAQLADLPPELRPGPVQAEATRHFARAERQARKQVLAALDGPEYAALRSDLADLLDRPPLTRVAGSKKLSARPAERRLKKAMRAAVGGGDETAVHAARKSVKRLRYAEEVAGRKRRDLKAVQRALGEHQDAVVARDALRELGATAENGFAFGLLHGRAEARAAQIREELPALWKRARKA